MKNKKIGYSIAAIVIVGSLAATGTYAYFTATRTTSANRFAQGTLDLNVMNGNVANDPFVIENMGATGNISGEKSWTINNTGSLPGRLLVRLQNVVNTENNCNDQEAMAEPACAADNLGELGGKVVLHVSVDGVEQATTTLATADEATLGARFAAQPYIIIPAGGSKTLRAYWATGENEYGNEIQSDGLQFDTNVRLIQAIEGAAPAN